MKLRWTVSAMTRFGLPGNAGEDAWKGIVARNNGVEILVFPEFC